MNVYSVYVNQSVEQKKCQQVHALLISVICWKPPQNLGLNTMIYCFLHLCGVTGLSCVVLLVCVGQGSHTGIQLSWGRTMQYGLSFSKASFHATLCNSVVWLGLLTNTPAGLQEEAFLRTSPNVQVLIKPLLA